MTWPEVLGLMLGSAFGGAVLSASGQLVIDRFKAKLRGTKPPPKRP